MPGGSRVQPRPYTQRTNCRRRSGTEAVGRTRRARSRSPRRRGVRVGGGRGGRAGPPPPALTRRSPGRVRGTGRAPGAASRLPAEPVEHRVVEAVDQAPPESDLQQLGEGDVARPLRLGYGATRLKDVV